ncbi:MAG: hypothetical protein J6Y64_06350 [Ruminococcus sp.]|nr:hypothetical protein [Ruminococcus sp.]
MLKKAFKAALIIIAVIAVWHLYLIVWLASSDIIVKKKSSSNFIFSTTYYYAIKGDKAMPTSEPLLNLLRCSDAKNQSYYSDEAVPCYRVGKELYGESETVGSGTSQLKVYPIRKGSPELTRQDRKNIMDIAALSRDRFTDTDYIDISFCYIPYDGEAYFYYDYSADENDRSLYKLVDGEAKEIHLKNSAHISYIYFK